MINQIRLFNPLSGDELKVYLKDRFAKLIDADTNLEAHLQFPLLTYRLQLQYEAYPMGCDITISEGGQIIATGEGITLDSTPVKAKFDELREIGATQESAPDAIRGDVGLPIRHPEPTPNGIQEVETESPAISVSVGGGTRNRR